jgi:hypothetical protein
LRSSHPLEPENLDNESVEMTADREINDNKNSFEDDIEEYGCLVLPLRSHVDK